MAHSYTRWGEVEIHKVLMNNSDEVNAPAPKQVDECSHTWHFRAWRKLCSQDAVPDAFTL